MVRADLSCWLQEAQPGNRAEPAEEADMGLQDLAQSLKKQSNAGDLCSE